jgi:hypothetical protein
MAEVLELVPAFTAKYSFLSEANVLNVVVMGWIAAIVFL